jgi:branched chain amino acid efflux pump
MTVAMTSGAESPPIETTTRSIFVEGVRDITPMVLGVLPFALAIGAAIGAADLSRGEGLFSGPVILAGASQLATVEMLDEGVAPLVIIVAALMINLRVLLYGASLAPWFAGHSAGRRLLLAIPVIDQLHFTCLPRFERGDLDLSRRTAYYAGAALWLAGGFVGAQIASILVGAHLPDALGLEVAAPLALVGLVAKSTVDRPSTTAAIVGCTVSVAAVGFPFHTSLLVGSVAGMVSGSLIDRRGHAEGTAERATESPTVGDVPS